MASTTDQSSTRIAEWKANFLDKADFLSASTASTIKLYGAILKGNSKLLTKEKR
jgi:hypothetical protein